MTAHHHPFVRTDFATGRVLGQRVITEEHFREKVEKLVRDILRVAVDGMPDGCKWHRSGAVGIRIYIDPDNPHHENLVVFVSDEAAIQVAEAAKGKRYA